MPIQVENDVRRIITAAIIVVTATITTAWSMATVPGDSSSRGFEMAAGLMPTHTAMVW